MITLLTGLPGNGKTLFALWHVKKYSEAENRKVYYSGISNLQLPWELVEPEKWHDLPPGSIIVIDEAQTVFPKKPNGASLPDFYSKLAVHRHKGFDIFLITQHPSLVDNFVRQLCGRHYHTIRKFGMSRSTIYEWSAVNAAPQSATSHKNAITLKWAYPTEVYGYYKSAEVHTVKRSIPAKLILAILFVIGVACFGYYMLMTYQDRALKKQAETVASSSSSSPVLPGPGGLSPVPVLSPMDQAKLYVAANTPRVSGLPHTAPKYDEITKPVRAPVPSMCVATTNKCKCFSQQATPMDVPFVMCTQFARHGFFLDFNPDGQRGRERELVIDNRGRSVGDGRSAAPGLSDVQAAYIPHNLSDYTLSSYSKGQR